MKAKEILGSLIMFVKVEKFYLGSNSAPVEFD